MIDRDNDLDPPFCCRSLLVRPDGSTVDHLDVTVVRSGDGVHHTVPDAYFAPPNKAIVACRTGTIAFGQVPPWRTGSQYPEDAVQHTTVIDARHASGLIGKKWLDHAPLEVSQVISAHAGRESDFRW